jgi:hypothetical protein
MDEVKRLVAERAERPRKERRRSPRQVLQRAS